MESFHTSFAIVANGSIDDYDRIAPLIREHACVIAADGGLIHCNAMGIVPDLIIGDLDSAPRELLTKYSQVPVREFPHDKNETDLELSVMAVYRPEIEKVTLFGALGKRSDHAVYNMQLLRRYYQKVVIQDEKERVFAFKGEIEIPCTPGQEISFIQLGEPALGVSSQGLKWELNRENFNQHYMSLSNVCLGKSVRISIDEGDLICFLQDR